MITDDAAVKVYRGGAVALDELQVPKQKVILVQSERWVRPVGAPLFDTAGTAAGHLHP